MYRYILKRLLFLIPTVLGVTLIIFAVMNITPGNPGRMILGANANAAEVEAVNQELGFYDPVLVRWARYLEARIEECAAARGYFDWYAFRLPAGRHGYHGKIVFHPGYWFSNR